MRWWKSQQGREVGIATSTAVSARDGGTAISAGVLGKEHGTATSRAASGNGHGIKTFQVFKPQRHFESSRQRVFWSTSILVYFLVHFQTFILIIYYFVWNEGGFGKRAWNSNFSGGLGKRAWNSGFSGKQTWNIFWNYTLHFSVGGIGK